MIKLREFRNNLDPKEYLNGEFRQNLKFLNSIIDKFNALWNKQSVFTFSSTLSVSGSDAKVNIDGASLSDGFINSNFYFPKTGNYEVQLSSKLNSNTSKLAQIKCVNKSGVEIGQGLSLSSASLLTATLSTCFIAKIKEEEGIGFIASSESGSSINGIFIKLTKAG